MTLHKIPEYAQNEHNFYPPPLTHELWKKLLQMFLDGAVISQELEEYLKNNKKHREKVITCPLERFKKIGNEMKFIFEGQNHRLPTITPKEWEKLKEYYLLGFHLARQIEQYALSENRLVSRFRIAMNVSERSFCGRERDIEEFFSHSPYQAQ